MLQAAVCFVPFLLSKVWKFVSTHLKKLSWNFPKYMWPFPTQCFCFLSYDFTSYNWHWSHMNFWHVLLLFESLRECAVLGHGCLILFIFVFSVILVTIGEPSLLWYLWGLGPEGTWFRSRSQCLLKGSLTLCPLVHLGFEAPCVYMKQRGELGSGSLWAVIAEM